MCLLLLQINHFFPAAGFQILNVIFSIEIVSSLCFIWHHLGVCRFLKISCLFLSFCMSWLSSALFAAGVSCDQCRDGTYSFGSSVLLGCQMCPCSVAGTVNGTGSCDKTMGACLCKANVEGQGCDRCKANTWGLNATNPIGCQTCDCDPLGIWLTTTWLLFVHHSIFLNLKLQLMTNVCLLQCLKFSIFPATLSSYFASNYITQTDNSM